MVKEVVMDFDAIIVGGGAAGAAMTWQLARNGLKVACLERGPWMQPNSYPSTSPDWEVQKAAEFSPVPAMRNSRYDYPIDDKPRPSPCATSTLSVAAQFCIQDISPGSAPAISS